MNKRNLKKRVCRKTGGAMLLLAGTPVLLFGAQSVIMSSPPPDTTPSWSEQESTNDITSVFVPATDVRRSPDQPFVFHEFVLRPHVDYSYVYATGVKSSTNQANNTVIQTVSPGLSLDMGKHWTLDYTPTLTYYTSKAFTDSLNHSASLNGSTFYDDWLLNLSQTFTHSSTPVSETAQQTEQTEYVTALGASYPINDRMSVNFGVEQDFNEYTGFGSSKTWSTSDSIDYSFWTRLIAGINVGGGYIEQSQGDQDYQTAQLTLKWRVTDKLSISASGGGEYQQFATAGEDPALTPIYNATIQYQPFKDTQISLTAGQTVGSDLFQAATTPLVLPGEDVELLSEGSSQISTMVTLSLNQQLLKKFNLNLSASYNENDFNDFTGYKVTPTSPPGPSVPVTISNNRTDTSYTFAARLSHGFLKRGSFALTYQNTQYSSTMAGFSYNSNQVGFDVSYSY